MGKIKSTLSFIGLLCLLVANCTYGQHKKPVMGWSSWNNYRIHISEEIIRAQADAMASNGMKEAGYSYINIDDGYFGGRDSLGRLLSHPEKFPGGMKALAAYIHALDLKAGIYTDAGANTCGSHWDKDPWGIGVGLHGHEREDLALLLLDWDYDFLKVDWCGGKWLKLDRQGTYTRIGDLIAEIKPGAVFNVCCWEFPGEWVTTVADSWRISGDISNRFGSILRIIDRNAGLAEHASPGHYNDMDMLQVGRGMSYEEDKAHFSMWCMMNSPLLAGNDLTTMSLQTLEILTNRELIALNQDELAYQARLIAHDKGVDTWLKQLIAPGSGELAVALLNRSGKKKTAGFELEELGLDPARGYSMTDLWTGEQFGTSTETFRRFEIEPHGIVVLRIRGEGSE